jgi:hypothetical protein
MQLDQDQPYNTAYATPASNHAKVGLGYCPISLAATQGVEVSFLSSGYLDVSVRLLTFRTLCVQIRMTGHYPSRVSPFGNPRVKGCSAPHRGLSQPSTSFFGS